LNALATPAIEQRVEHDSQNTSRSPQPLVVLEPDERADAADAGIGEREPDAEPSG